MISSRPFDDARHDFEKMWRFVQQDYAHKQDHFIWLFSRLGLGEAVIRACFDRLRQHGIDKTYITGYSREANGLYEKLGPRERKRWYHYERAA